MVAREPKSIPAIRKWLIAAVGAIAAIAIVPSIISVRIGPGLRGRVIQEVSERYKSGVELKSLHVSFFPLSATGTGLVLRHHGRTDVPPLVTVQKFTIRTSLIDLVRGPTHVRSLRLEGLEIHVPPKGKHIEEKESDHQNEVGKKPQAKFVIDEVIADRTVLKVLRKKPGAEPLTFELHRLRLHSAGVGQAMTFRSTLNNAKPPGLVETDGKFGPWNADEPGDTPVSGVYTFRNADLSAFKGISGKLSSDGKYEGSLGHIVADGKTDTPDFALTISGNPLRLITEYHAIIDGGDGDTILQPVNAHFLNSNVVARGSVAGTEGVHGKTVSLDADISRARIEDMLRLAMKSDKPLMTGQVDSTAKIIIPPGHVDVIDKLILEGQFHVTDGKFLNLSVQQKVEDLSRHARGQTESGGREEIVSNLKGRFKLDKGVMSFSELSFGVPGALIQLHGSYGLRNEQLDFHGMARMEAKLSEMTTGFKSFLLKLADPFFKKKGAGAVIPIKITGTRKEPSFGLDLKP